jgi:multidrug efflux pump subunit AcrA (membrane-fusion protein)
MKSKALAFCVLALCLVACSKPEEKETEAPAPVQVTAVTQDTIRRLVRGDGVLYPRDQASVMPKISAPVQKFSVNRGDHVKRGQLLATLENRDLVAAANESKDAVTQAEANLRNTEGASVPDSVVKAQTDVEAAREARDAAKRVLDSRQQLLKEGALARKLVDDAQVAYAQADSQFRAAQEHLRTLQSVGKQEQIRGAAAQVSAAKSHYQSLEAQVVYSQVTSPISGVIADRPVYAGEMASQGSPLVTVMDISRVVARVNVPQEEISYVKLGQPAIITQNDEGAGETTGKVTVVSPATDPNSTTVQVWIEIPNSDEHLKPGTSVHAAIVTQEFKATATVPAAAILPGEEGGTSVIVVTPDSVAHKRAVKLGIRDGNKVQVLSGVNPGEEVVIVGGMGVDDKAKVKVIDTSVKEEEEEEPDTGADDKKEAEKPKSK